MDILAPRSQGHATPQVGRSCIEPHVDGCPGCVVNVEPPADVLRLERGCLADYRCTDCGHEWSTSWGRC